MPPSLPAAAANRVRASVDRWRHPSWYVTTKVEKGSYSDIEADEDVHI